MKEDILKELKNCRNEMDKFYREHKDKFDKSF